MDRRFDDHRLQYLLAAAETGSVRAAADRLDVNPSAVSRQIAQLEADLAIPLLERHSRGVRLTEAGGLVVDHHRRQRSDRADLLAKLHEIADLDRGHIDLVLGEGFAADLMAGPLAEFWSRHPGLTMTMDLAGTNEVMRLVAEDAGHIGLVYAPPVDHRIRSHAVTRQPMCAILRPDHPLAGRPAPLPLADLLGRPLALMHAAYGTRQIIEAAAAAEKLRVAPRLTTSSIAVAKQFVRDTGGATLLPGFAAAPEIEAGQLVAIPLAGAVLAAAEAHLVTRQGRQLPAAASRLLRHLAARLTAFRSS